MLSQTVVGGYTQYLTAAQGMPTRVEKALESMTLDFFWGHARRHPVNMDTLRLSRNTGGANLLHIKARNDAQYMMWLGEYLAPRGERPVWAFLADQLLQGAMILTDRNRVPERGRTNPFEQDWRPNLRKLPFILRCMVRMARRYQLVLDAPEIPQHLRERMNIWAHPALLEPEQWRNTGRRTRCLRVKHKVCTVEDLEEMAELDDSEHEENSGCDCENCTEDHAQGCRHPYKCQSLVAEMIGAIAEKWNPNTAHVAPPRRLRDDLADMRETAIERGEALVFDDSRVNDAEVSNLYRICVDKPALQGATASEIMRGEATERMQGGEMEDPVHVAVCAAIREDDDGTARAGFAIVFPDKEYTDIKQSCVGEQVPFARAAALAVIAAVLAVPGGRTLHIIMTGRALVEALTTRLDKNEQRGWTDWRDDEKPMHAAAAILRSRAGETTFTHVDKKSARAWPELRRARELAALAV
ncbi:hypothetical protein AURDEDRAFT_131366 [Auricularia subglabra TFB-10046 SS5]|uniref:RNase H type-1 domain-containing protein n=1 Tax=Auricularia subglabra (strain TFB-10046 / SS5) TaxID=717982 RepID=J0D5K9_AURST|nr:hypothetical protein AURDEDRAFT_131366 [Auricularia subglabra TFB-10046 SS5]